MAEEGEEYAAPMVNLEGAGFQGVDSKTKKLNIRVKNQGGLISTLQHRQPKKDANKNPSQRLSILTTPNNTDKH